MKLIKMSESEFNAFADQYPAQVVVVTGRDTLALNAADISTAVSEPDPGPPPGIAVAQWLAETSGNDFEILIFRDGEIQQVQVQFEPAATRED